MSIRRSKFEIYMDILTQVKNGVNLPTRIMYGTNLSWLSLNQVMKQLVTQGLIEEYREETPDRRTKTTYRITERGDKFLEYLGFAIGQIKLEDV
jgi:predicted transcriptional regulator